MRIFENFDLTNFNSYKIKSYCSIAFFPEIEDDFLEIFKHINDKDFIILGNGNNIILSKTFYDCPFIILNNTFNKIHVNENFIDAECGATTFDVSSIALKYRLTGIEFLYDIPSSIGGAVVMNAGTKEGETKDVIYKVRYLDLNEYLIKEIFNKDMALSYRNSFFQNNTNYIILKAWFKLEEGDYEQIKILMNKTKERRWAMQPRELPNCGSVFKRPPGRFVGPMIDELGLRGFSIGDAQISEKHSGFIVNTGGATGENILALIAYIQKKVKENYGLELEIEQKIL